VQQELSVVGEPWPPAGELLDAALHPEAGLLGAVSQRRRRR
jgi:hypothetical protein